MMNRLTKSFFIVLLLFVTGFFPVFGVSLGGTLETSVVDEADILSDVYEAELINAIVLLEQETTAQLAIVTVASLNGRDIFDVGLDFARYGTDDVDKIEDSKNNEFVGNSKYNNGLVIVVAPEERKWNIQVGDGLEGRIPDAVAKRMGQQILVPAFRQESYGEGLKELVRIISSEIKDEAVEADWNREGSQESDVALMDLLIIFFLIAMFIGPLLQQFLKTDNDKYYGSGVGSGILTVIGSLFVGWSALWLIIPLFILLLFALYMKPGSGGGGGSYGGGGFSSGGGSFSSWGGGSFSGGGASGSW